ncbi:hypothetical protein WJX81_008066 [Elliptochloris bilobata]|uniref:Uncharacterized protein n=1 Tax=Elliptochloris bilobata TaxID=381761 RepID=A0AAW1R3H4_9CHLO
MSTSDPGVTRKQAQDICVREALVEGAKAAAWAGGISGSAVFLANHFLLSFRRALGVSGKTALIVTPIFGMYFLQAELTMNECSRRRKWTERPMQTSKVAAHRPHQPHPAPT